MRAVIISGGSIKDYNYIKSLFKADDFIICADSGYDHAVKMGVKADLLVGDLDSIIQQPQNIACIKFPKKKDYTDTEIALEQAREKGYNSFLLVAATGSRMDHTLANIMMLIDCLKRGEYAEVIDEHNRIMITNSQLNVRECKEAIISLIPLTDCFGVTTTNLEYQLYDATLYMGKALSLSNSMMENTANISVRGGILLVIVAKD